MPPHLSDTHMADANRWRKIWDYSIVLLVFAVTGSSAAYVGGLLMPYTGLERAGGLSTAIYIIVYILLITPIYQVLLLGYAFLFGKYAYFLEKQKKLFRWISGRGRKAGDKGESQEGRGE